MKKDVRRIRLPHGATKAMNGDVCIVVALKAEAHCLIDHFRLKRVSDNRLKFPIYSNGQINLIVSGVGKHNCAGAIERYGAVMPSHQAMGWLNVGIAGHGTRQVGEGLMGNRIEDRAASKIWYPSFVKDFRCEVGTIVTTDEVETRFGDDGVYEMECSGFFSAACRQTKLDLVHSYKVISDNKSNPSCGLTKDAVSKLIGSHVERIESICSTLSHLVSKLDARTRLPVDYNRFLARWHFSETQKHLLRRMLKKREVLGIETSVGHAMLRNCESSRAVIQVLQSELKSYWNR